MIVVAVLYYSALQYWNNWCNEISFNVMAAKWMTSLKGIFRVPRRKSVIEKEMQFMTAIFSLRSCNASGCYAIWWDKIKSMLCLKHWNAINMILGSAINFCWTFNCANLNVLLKAQTYQVPSTVYPRICNIERHKINFSSFTSAGENSSENKSTSKKSPTTILQ